MKPIKIFLCLVVLAIAGCDRWAEEQSDEMTEPAKVVQLVFSPSLHSSSLSPGMTMKGKMTLTHTSVNIPEKYAVVFECQHGKFVIEGDKGKAMWDKLHNNQDVTIHYREIYSAHYDGDGKLIERQLKKYDFIDAVAATPTTSPTSRP